MKQVSTLKEQAPDFDFETTPSFFSSVPYDNKSILSAVCMANSFSIEELLANNGSLHVTNIHVTERSEDNKDSLTTRIPIIFTSLDMFNKVIVDDKLDNYSHVDIHQVKLSKDANGLLIGCTFFPKEVSDENKIRTYLIYYRIHGIWCDKESTDSEFTNWILNTLLSESVDTTNYKSITSLECSDNGIVISLILGNDTHVCLRGKLSDDYDEVFTFITNYVEELRNTTKVINPDNERTLYSTISSSGNRIAIGNRDNRNAVKNNSVIATVGNITFLTYDYFKKQWVLEDIYFERNLYIQNMGEHVSMNRHGDKLITIARYIDEKGNNKNVIYLLARDSKGKWKKFLREIVEEKVTGLEISSDGNKALVHVLNDYGTPRTSKGLKYFFRKDKDMYYVNLTDKEGNLIFSDVEKKFDYISTSVVNPDHLHSFIVTKGRIVDEESNSEVIDENYTVIYNELKL